MIPEIRARIDRKFAKRQAMPEAGDPAIAPRARAIAVQVRRAQAFEGAIIAETVPAVRAQAPHLTVLAQPRIALANRAIEHADRNVKFDVGFGGSGRERKLDTLVFDHATGIVEIAEVKRGRRPIGADHSRNRKSAIVHRVDNVRVHSLPRAWRVAHTIVPDSPPRPRLPSVRSR